MTRVRSVEVLPGGETRTDARRLTGTEVRVARAWVPTVLSWLRRAEPDAVLDALGAAPPQTLPTLRHLLTTQGLAPRVAALLPDAGDVGRASEVDRTVDWLRGQLAQNRDRMDRFAEDLSAVLERASAVGATVMPMKGAVIAFLQGRDPGLRPMADLDLLVAEVDVPALDDVLDGLGYRLVRDHRRHRVYGRPADRVVAYDATHPDNPRRVEVHTHVFRGVFKERGPIDLAHPLWASGREATLLGRPALLPSDEALLVDVAWHATEHLVRRSGRLLQLLDVASWAASAETADASFAPYAFPALAMAARAVPSPEGRDAAARLAPHVAPGLVRFAERVPIDDRAGFNLSGVASHALPWWVAQWRNWRPSPWAARLAFPRLPVPMAHALYVGAVATYGVDRVVRSTVRSQS